MGSPVADAITQVPCQLDASRVTELVPQTRLI